MARSFGFHLFVVAGLFFVQVNLCKAAPTSGHTDFEKQLETVLKSAGSVNQEELVELVKKLRETFLAEENDDDLSKVLDRTPEAVQINFDKCWIGQMYDLTSVVETAKTLPELNGSAKFMDYIKQLANSHFKKCKSRLGHAFQRCALSIDRNAKNSVDHLIDAIVSAKLLDGDLPSDDSNDKDEHNSGDEDFQHSFVELAGIDDQFISGVVSFIQETNFGFKSDSAIPTEIKENKEEFAARFQTYTGEFCSPMEFMLTEFVEIYYSFLGLGMAAQDDEFVRDWVTRVKLCRTIRNNLEEVSERTREAWLKRSAQ